MTPEEKIAELKRLGYCVVSRRYGMLSRIDRADWKDVMAKAYAPWDIKDGFKWIKLLGERGAEDHYRRVYSKDTIEPQDIPRERLLKEMPNSNDMITGYCEVSA